MFKKHYLNFWTKRYGCEICRFIFVFVNIWFRVYISSLSSKAVLYRSGVD